LALLPIFLLLPLFSPTVASAQTDSRSADGSLEAIRKQMEKGQGLFLAKNYQEAAATFEEGYKSYPYSAFLFNAGVCYQKLGNADAALSSFRSYLQKDPTAPDAAAVRERIAKIEEAKKAAKDDAADGEPAPVEMPDSSDQGMKSLVVIETEPPGAPVRVYRRTEDYAPEFVPGAKNSLWVVVAQRPAPLNLTLDVGRYHIVIDEFQEYNSAETNLDVSPGHVHHFKANLSQGEFTGFLEVTSNVVGAKLFLDDTGDKTAVWGQAPHGALISPGEHTLRVEAPGYEPTEMKVEVATGDKKIVEVLLTRVGFGVLRLDADVAEITLSIDGRPFGAWRQGESALEAELTAGPHEVLVSAKGYKDLRKTVNVPKGQILPMRARMIEKFPRGAAWTQAILSAGFIGASVYFGVESNRLNRELIAEREAGYLHDKDPRIKQGFWYSIGADAGFSVGGILALLATYNFIRDPYPDPKLQLGKTREFKRYRTGP
jgi:hypothetical protein